MRRRKLLSRKANLKPKVPAKRSAKAVREKLRAYGPAERRAWIASLPCVICSATPSQNAHVRTSANAGTGYKPDAKWIIPLCARCHQLQEDHGWLAIGWTREKALDYAAIVDSRWEREVHIHLRDEEE